MFLVLRLLAVTGEHLLYAGRGVAGAASRRHADDRRGIARAAACVGGDTAAAGPRCAGLDKVSAQARHAPQLDTGVSERHCVWCSADGTRLGVRVANPTNATVRVTLHIAGWSEGEVKAQVLAAADPLAVYAEAVPSNTTLAALSAGAPPNYPHRNLLTTGHLISSDWLLVVRRRVSLERVQLPAVLLRNLPGDQAAGMKQLLRRHSLAAPLSAVVLACIIFGPDERDVGPNNCWSLRETAPCGCSGGRCGAVFAGRTAAGGRCRTIPGRGAAAGCPGPTSSRGRTACVISS